MTLIEKLTAQDLGDYFTIHTELLNSRNEMVPVAFPAVLYAIGEIDGTPMYSFMGRSGLCYSTTNLDEVTRNEACTSHWYLAKPTSEIKCVCCGKKLEEAIEY